MPARLQWTFQRGEIRFRGTSEMRCSHCQLGYPTWMATRQLPWPGDKDTAHSVQVFVVSERSVRYGVRTSHKQAFPTKKIMRRAEESKVDNDTKSPHNCIRSTHCFFHQTKLLLFGPQARMLAKTGRERKVETGRARIPEVWRLQKGVFVSERLACCRARNRVDQNLFAECSISRCDENLFLSYRTNWSDKGGGESGSYLPVVVVQQRFI